MSLLNLSPERLLDIYERMLAAYGPQHWWPADSPFEVMVGAVLTQNTAWGNVEKAIVNLKGMGLLDPVTLTRAEPSLVAEAIRPAGYFNVKTRRLQSFCHFLVERGGEAALGALETHRLRQDLLAVHGVGPETADDMLLYAFERPVFVIDAYTRRLLSRNGLIGGEEGYETLRHGFESALPSDAPLFNEYHALIVRHAKEACRKKPQCGNCCLRGPCPAAG
ncbi:MAG: endonuclease III domain-containing protein [Gammaproteobacteria bacterium]|nr:endonuclease III domain-containing protein [Gammaproteobacteria bacterium]MBU1654496.1 endonuclease III domain-containing protein [Gammaproteobacteria bacterium]MBU1960683.1 endonuclease III domain-containing protein [Gammaproteobacteria bacterium]